MSHVTHIFLSHVTHMNESCHAYECLQKGACTLVLCTRLDEACYKYVLESCHTFEWVMSRTRMVAERPVYSSNAQTYEYVMLHKCACVMSHVSISDVICMRQSRHMYESFMSHISMFAESRLIGWFMKESCHTYESLQSGAVYYDDSHTHRWFVLQTWASRVT